MGGLAEGGIPVEDGAQGGGGLGWGMEVEVGVVGVVEVVEED